METANGNKDYNILEKKRCQSNLNAFVSKSWKHAFPINKRLIEHPPIKRVRKLKVTEPNVPLQPTSKKRVKTSTLQQMYLDFGQKNLIGHRLCDTCGMLYTMGVEEDEKEHMKICNQFMYGVPVHTKNCKILAKHLDDVIIEIDNLTDNFIRQRIITVHEIVNKELRFSVDMCKQNTKDYIYVANKRVVGLVTVETIDKAHVWKNCETKMKEKTEAILGVYKMWVCATHRRKGIMSKLLEAVRVHTVFSFEIPLDKIAFSSPTQAGMDFACKYVHNTSILVYDP